jgi:hypothetical protein
VNQEDLDRMLSRQENIVPSSGFVGRVMEVVECAASTPPPIPFPWKHALPGLAAWLIPLVSFVYLAFAHFDASSTRSALARTAPMLAAIIEGLKAVDGAWIAVALLVSAASVFFSMRMVGARL